VALYFLDFYDHEISLPANEGAEFSDQAAVTGEALRALCEIIADQPQRYTDRKPRIVVRDSAGQTVHVVSLEATATGLRGNPHPTRRTAAA